MTRAKKVRLSALGRIVDYASREAEDMELPALGEVLDFASAMIDEVVSGRPAPPRRPRLTLVLGDRMSFTGEDADANRASSAADPPLIPSA